MVPKQASLELLDAARRVPLSCDAAAMSLGHFLEVSFGARHLSVGPRPLHAGYARYFGRGSAVACFLWERVGPAHVDMPPQHMHYYVPAQQGWIKDEVEELIEASHLLSVASYWQGLSISKTLVHGSPSWCCPTDVVLEGLGGWSRIINRVVW